jgi:hypothetical protein
MNTHHFSHWPVLGLSLVPGAQEVQLKVTELNDWPGAQLIHCLPFQKGIVIGHAVQVLFCSCGAEGGQTHFSLGISKI